MRNISPSALIVLVTFMLGVFAANEYKKHTKPTLLPLQQNYSQCLEQVQTKSFHERFSKTDSLTPEFCSA